MNFALIVIITIVVALVVLLLIAIIITAITVPIIVLSGKNNQGVPEPEICPDCNGNLKAYYIAQKDNKADINTLSALEATLGTSLEFANGSFPVAYFCDTSFPNSIPFYKTVTGCGSNKVTSLLSTIESMAPEVCNVELVGYAQNPLTFTSEMLEPCCNITPQFIANFIQYSENHNITHVVNFGKFNYTLTNAYGGVLDFPAPIHNIDCLSPST